MEKPLDVKSFLAQVDSIQRRFMESLITGQRDPIFRKTETTREPEPEMAQSGAEAENHR
jgi:hypothetical protein